jgi:hypothetical protein
LAGPLVILHADQDPSRSSGGHVTPVIVLMLDRGLSTTRLSSGIRADVVNRATAGTPAQVNGDARSSIATR